METYVEVSKNWDLQIRQQMDISDHFHAIISFIPDIEERF
jgi:hypothetical protein